jgi:hypothetical protein
MSRQTAGRCRPLLKTIFSDASRCRRHSGNRPVSNRRDDWVRDASAEGLQPGTVAIQFEVTAPRGSYAWNVA